uniref:EF-hand domain-containing protein n=1 Tax=Hanusia phi TaxID=3032 RepID=A0A7S0HN54_9CRYP
MKKAFRTLDLNEDGKISFKEMRAGLALMDAAVTVSDEELRKIFYNASNQDKKSIDLEEFLSSCGPHSLYVNEIERNLSKVAATADGKGFAFVDLSAKSHRLTDVVAIKDYVHLRFVDFSHNMLKDVTCLGCLPHLVKVDLSYNQLTSVLSFRPPLALREANCSHNCIGGMNDVSGHRFLEVLDLSSNSISSIDGISQNFALKKLVLDDNEIMQLANLHDLRLQHLSVANNRLSAVIGFEGFQEDELEVFRNLEACYDEMKLAFDAMDANQDGILERKEFLRGLKLIEPAPDERVLHKILDRLDKNRDGTIDKVEFLSLARRHSQAMLSVDNGIEKLDHLVELNLSGNVITRLHGFGHHPSLRRIDLSSTAVESIEELKHLAHLPLLEDLNLSNTIVAQQGDVSRSSCFRLKAIHILNPPVGKCKLKLLNEQFVSAEEVVSSLNFYDEHHPQYQDTRRDDAQDLPPALYQ